MVEGELYGTSVTGAGRWSWRDVAVAGAVAVLAALVRSNAVHGALVWDDHLIVSALGREGGFSLGMLLGPAQGVPGFRARFYHPLQLLLYGLGWSIGGQQPQAYHALLVAAHALVAAAVTLYAAALFRGTKGATVPVWWAGCTFAVLPIHTQAVNWVICCTDVLAAGCLVGAAIAGLARRTTVCAVGTATALFGALCAKETALAALAFLPLQAALLSAPAVRRRRVIVVCVSCALTVIVYLGLRAHSGFPVLGPLPTAESDALRRGWSALPSMVGWYAVRLAVPVEAMGELLTVPGGTGPFALGVLATGGMVLLVAYAWRHGDRVALTGAAWIVLFLLPALTPAATVGQPLALHRLYIPSIGLVILLADGAARAVARWNHVRVVSAIGVAILATLAVRSWQGTTVWRDEASFWSAMVRANPGQAFPLGCLGEAAARQHLGRATVLGPGTVDGLRAAALLRRLPPQ